MFDEATSPLLREQHDQGGGSYEPPFVLERRCGLVDVESTG